ncbi:unnamed protein product [Urochloa decumbens]|uniref:Uncharacterized protein n=1 Tax=Urochloa decumbens TaxID=240449 RepID=A0ABC9FEV2_9POAL
MGMAKELCYFCCCCCLVLVMLTVIGLVAFGFVAVAKIDDCVVPFHASVDEASLARLSLAAPAAGNNNGTRPAAASSLAYDLALMVSLRRRNSQQAAVVSRASPLDAEVRFLGRPLSCARLAGAEWAAATGDLSDEMVYRLAWNGETNATALALGPGAAAAFAAESAAGVFVMELVVRGEFKSAARFSSGWCPIRVRCPMRLSVSTAAAPAPFARVECASRRRS